MTPEEHQEFLDWKEKAGKPNIIHQATSQIDRKVPEDLRPAKIERSVSEATSKKKESPMFSRLSENIDDIEESLLDGATFRDLAFKYSVSLGTFTTWRLTSEHSARIDLALVSASEFHAAESLKVLQEGIDSGTENLAEASLRRELAGGHRWMAKVRNPKVFSDKVQHDHDHRLVAPATDHQFDKLLDTVVVAQSKMQSEAEDIDHEDLIQ